MTKRLMRTLLILFAAMAGLPVVAQTDLSGEQYIYGPDPVFGVHEGAYYNFRWRCAHCHGPRGQGIPPVGPALLGNAFVKNAREADLASTIRNGRKSETKRYPQYIREKDGYMNMPSFDRDTLSDFELAALVKYLKGPLQEGKFHRP